MQKNEVQEILRALNDSQVRYLIVGGLAVVAHGYVRFTADLDLVLAVDELNLRQAVHALQTLEYRPRAPVPFEQFIDPVMRNKWASEKGMRVFSLFSSRNSKTEVDLFLESPLDFTPAYERALRLDTGGGVTATFVGFDDLIHLKEIANRPLDQNDIIQLRALKEIKP